MGEKLIPVCPHCGDKGWLRKGDTVEHVYACPTLNERGVVLALDGEGPHGCSKVLWDDGEIIWHDTKVLKSAAATKKETSLTVYCHHCGAVDSIYEVVRVNQAFRVDFNSSEHNHLYSEQWGDPVSDSPHRGDPEPLYYVCSQCNRTVDEEKLRFTPAARRGE